MKRTVAHMWSRNGNTHRGKRGSVKTARAIRGYSLCGEREIKSRDIIKQKQALLFPVYELINL